MKNYLYSIIMLSLMYILNIYTYIYIILKRIVYIYNSFCINDVLIKYIYIYIFNIFNNVMKKQI